MWGRKVSIAETNWKCPKNASQTKRLNKEELNDIRKLMKIDRLFWSAIKECLKSMHFHYFRCYCCCEKKKKVAKIVLSIVPSHCVAIVHSFIKKIATDSFEFENCRCCKFFCLFTIFIVSIGKERGRIRRKIEVFVNYV